MVNLLNKKPEKADADAKKKQAILPNRQYSFLLFVKQFLTETKANVRVSALIVYIFGNKYALLSKKMDYGKKRDYQQAVKT